MNFLEYLILLILPLVRESFCELMAKIVGGTTTSIQEWPFIAFLSIKAGDYQMGCGASLIGPRMVLTAAHCLDDVTDGKANFKLFDMNILMGHTNIFKTNMIRKVIDYETHKKYSPDESVADIGVAFLQKPVANSNKVKIATLMKKPMTKSEEMLMIAGWGGWSDPINETHPFSDKLLFMHQMWIPNCVKYIKDIEEGTICAGKEGDVKFVYSGDSGGPLVTFRGKIQVGIVSYKPTNKNGITVYTSVPYYFKWIKQAQAKLRKHNSGRR